MNISISDSLLYVSKQGRILHSQQSVDSFDRMLQHGQFGSIIVIPKDNRLMRLLQSIRGEMQLRQFYLLVLRMLPQDQTPSPLETQLQLRWILTLAISAIF